VASLSERAQRERDGQVVSPDRGAEDQELTDLDQRTPVSFAACEVELTWKAPVFPAPIDLSNLVRGLLKLLPHCLGSGGFYRVSRAASSRA
jgi:hypothetical protein